MFEHLGRGELMVEIEVDGQCVTITHGGRSLFPGGGPTKGDLAEYLVRIAPVALPHWRARPVSLRRFPDGITGDGFFQKHAPETRPDFVTTVTLPAEGGTVTHVVIDSAATLAWLANLSTIECHLGLSRIDAPRYPDRLIFDLDPSTDDFGKVQAAARLVRKRLEREELTSRVLATGSRGLHVVVPIEPVHDFDVVHAFAKWLASDLARQHPETLTVAHRTSRRAGRVFVDYLRNGYGQTAIAPYSLRARESAPIATPVTWEEALAANFTPDRYRISNLFRRLGQRDDPWADLDASRQALAPALGRAGIDG